jgi:hypothetical protein
MWIIHGYDGSIAGFFTNIVEDWEQARPEAQNLSPHAEVTWTDNCRDSYEVHDADQDLRFECQRLDDPGMPFKVIIPEMGELMPYTGDLMIAAGEYDCNGIVELLRDHKNNPEAIQFIADMMER